MIIRQNQLMHIMDKEPVTFICTITKKKLREGLLFV